MDRQDDLTLYDKVTVSLWARSYRQLTSRPCWKGICLQQAAVSAVLAHLRDCETAHQLFERYDEGIAPDFALIGSLLPELESPTDELLWQIREAAFHLRWRELKGEGA